MATMMSLQSSQRVKSNDLSTANSVPLKFMDARFSTIKRGIGEQKARSINRDTHRYAMVRDRDNDDNTADIPAVLYHFAPGTL